MHGILGKTEDSSVNSAVQEDYNSVIQSLISQGCSADDANYEMHGKLYEIQTDVLERLYDYLLQDSITRKSVLLDIATGFGKSFLQISLAAHLEKKGRNYKIVVPDVGSGALVEQMKKDVDKLFCGELAKKVKSNIVDHKQCFLTNWNKTKTLSADTFFMIDEIDLTTHEFLYRARVETTLLEKYNCIFLSATPREWLYKHINNRHGKIINIPIKEKIKAMELVTPNLQILSTKSILAITNKRSKFFRYACVAATIYVFTFLAKVLTNTLPLEYLKHILIDFGIYNHLVTVFLLNPIIGVIAWALIFAFVVKPFNSLMERVSNKKVFERILANIKNQDITSPAHNDTYSIEENFVHKEGINQVEYAIQSPRGKKSLILSCNSDVLKNLSIIYRDGDQHVWKKGKLFNAFSVHDQYELGGDFNAKYDCSFKESQRLWCIEKYSNKVKEKLKYDGVSDHADKVSEYKSKVDFSDLSMYSEYKVMHGIINTTLLFLLQTSNRDGDNIKCDNIIALNKARIEAQDELLNNVRNTLDNEIDIYQIKHYLEEKGFSNDKLIDDMAYQINSVIDVLKIYKDNEEEGFDSIVGNWSLSKKLHNLMKRGDEYQVLNDICSQYDTYIQDEIQNSTCKSKKEIKQLMNNDEFNLKCKNRLSKYFNEEFGLEDSLPIDSIYDHLKSGNYKTLTSSLRQNQFMKKINAKEGKFPLYRLREFCEQNKIIFCNIGNFNDGKPFYKFDQNGECEKCQYTNKDITQLFVESWVGNLVDPSKTTGFSDVNLHNISTILGSKYDSIHTADILSQSYGRNRGMDANELPFFRLTTAKGIKLCFNLAYLNDDNPTQRLCVARKSDNKVFLARAKIEVLQEITTYVENNINEIINNKTRDDKILHEACMNITSSVFQELYRRNIDAGKEKRKNYGNSLNKEDQCIAYYADALEKTKKEFRNILKHVEKSLSKHGKTIKTAGRPSVLYTVPHSIALTMVKVLYYMWAALDYIVFYIQSIGLCKIQGDDMGTDHAKKATYIHIIKNYSLEGSIKRNQVMEKLLKLSNIDTNKVDILLSKDKKFGAICIRAYNVIIAPLNDYHLMTVLDLIYGSNDHNEEKLKKIRSSIEGKETICTETMRWVSDISREIVASHAWYHDATDIIRATQPKLKSNDSIFLVRNVNNMTDVLSASSNALIKKCTSCCAPVNKYFSHTLSDTSEVKNKYGNVHIKSALSIFKWLIILVVLPQIPYLLISSTLIASAVSSAICIPLFAFIFTHTSNFKSFIMNQKSADANMLECIFNEDKINVLENHATTAVRKYYKLFSQAQPMTAIDIDQGNCIDPVEKIMSISDNANSAAFNPDNLVRGF